MRKSCFKFFISLLVSFTLLYFVLQHFDLYKALRFIQHARVDYLVLAFGLIIIAYLVRGYRWMIWEKELNYWDSFQLILVGFMGNNLLPARLGEVLRAHCTASKTGKDYGRTAALASVAIERILDGLILSGIGLIGLILVSVSPILFYSLLFVSLVFSLLTGGLILGICIHKRVRRVFEKIHQIFPGHLTQFGKEKVNYFLDGLLLIKGFTKFFNAFFFTVVIWAIETISYYYVTNALYEGISVKTCFIFIAVVNFASLFPFTMGGIGVIEGTTTIFLISAGVPDNHALAMVVVQHLFQFGFTTITGAIFYFTGRYYNLSFLQGKIPEQNEQSVHQQHVTPDIVSHMYKHVESLSHKLNIREQRKRDVHLSLVIPAYNEQNRLPKSLLETISWCTKKTMNYELLIVDDGSNDDTLTLAKLFSEHMRDIRYIACPHHGKGATVRMGMLNAVGKYVLFMDADGATPLDEIPKLLAKLEEGVDIAIGSRVSQNPGDAQVITSLHRKIIGRIFAGIVSIFALPGFADTQCGFKMFRQEVIRDIFYRQKLNGFAFDVEILYIARKLEFSVVEVPVNWVNQEGSKVNIITDSIKMLFDILRIRWLHRNEQWKESPGEDEP